MVASHGSRSPRARRWPALGLAAGLLAALLLAAQPASAHVAKAQANTVGPKQYYLGLGDSLAFGYQPNIDWSHGYVQQWYNSDLKARGESLTNYGCNGEKSSTFITGGCPYAFALHNFYFGAQLSAAVNFIKLHAGKVSPVSLDMGANDLLPDIDRSTCTVKASWASDLATLDANMTGTILPKLTAALTNSAGQRTGDLVLMNYYNPFQNICPTSGSYIAQLNQHLAADAAQFNVPIVDVFTAFGGATTPNPNICTYTWMCSSSSDIHATSTGYGVIANTFKSGMGY